MKFDVAVIGAGVVGALCARELSRYRLRVVLLEKSDDVAGGASRANSGIVHGGFDPVPGTKKAALNLRGTAMMEGLTAELGVSYRKNGSLVLAFSEEEMEHVRRLYARGLENGVPGLSLLSAEELFALEPNVSKQAVGALRCTSSGIVCPYGLTIAAVGNAMDNGVSLVRSFDTVSIKNEEDGFLLTAAEHSKALLRIFRHIQLFKFFQAISLFIYHINDTHFIHTIMLYLFSRRIIGNKIIV